MTQKCLVLSSMVVFWQRWNKQMVVPRLPASQLFLSFPAHLFVLFWSTKHVLINQHCLHSGLPFWVEPGLLGSARLCLSRTVGYPWRYSAQQSQELENSLSAEIDIWPFHLFCFFVPVPSIIINMGLLVFFKPSRDFSHVSELLNYLVRKLVSLPGSFFSFSLFFHYPDFNKEMNSKRCWHTRKVELKLVFGDRFISICTDFWL